MASEQDTELSRELGLFGAMMMGLGSIVGTGVFVSIGLAAGVSGPSVVLAIAIAAGVATCNGLSSAQLAANHPVSGGTYEYGYEFMDRRWGFTAGWMFLLAKSASAATAALGFAGYVLRPLGIEAHPVHLGVGLIAVAALTTIIVRGIRQSNRVNIAIVSVAVGSLVFFIAAGLPSIVGKLSDEMTPFFVAPDDPWASLHGLLHAAALMFVAYTGYGRIATLGEEVEDPEETIPPAIGMTLVVSMLLYVGVGVVGVGALGASEFAQAARESAAPLEAAARTFGVPGGRWILAVGAVAAMVGVLLNLILGLSRVLLAMGRRADMPTVVARISDEHKSPNVAVVCVAVLIGGLVLIGNVETTWSFSAFTVLVYYAITNLSALQLSDEQRMFPRIIPMLGVVGCLGLAFWVKPAIWMTGLGLIAVGIVWHAVAYRMRNDE